VVKDLYGQKRAETVQLLIEYDPAPKVYSGHPSKALPEVLKSAKVEMIRDAKNIRDAISVSTILWQTGVNKVRRKYKRTKLEKAM